MTAKILVAEDDGDINQLIVRILHGAGYEAASAYSGTEALLMMKSDAPDLLLLDLMMPGMSGEEVLKKLRRDAGRTLPVIVLSAKDELTDKVALLDTGADDYMVKPFEPAELLARVRAALRRSPATPAESTLAYKNITLHPDIRRVTVNGREALLTPIEYGLLYALLRDPQKVWPREKLYEEVWKDGYYGTDHTVTVHMSNLKKKLKELDPDEEYILSVYGIGFRLAKS